MCAEKMNAILKWLRAKDTAWDVRICAAAAADGELEVLKFLRLPMGRDDVRERGKRRTPRGAEVGSRERLPLESGGWVQTR